MYFVDLAQDTTDAVELSRAVKDASNKSYKWCIVFPYDGSMSDKDIRDKVDEIEFNFAQKSLQMWLDTEEYPLYVNSERCWVAFFKSVSDINLDENEELA